MRIKRSHLWGGFAISEEKTTEEGVGQKLHVFEVGPTDRISLPEDFIQGRCKIWEFNGFLRLQREIWSKNCLQSFSFGEEDPRS